MADLIKANPGRITERALRDKYSGLNGKLGASESEVKRTLQRLLDEGNVISRAPTDQERKLHRLSHNVKAVLDLPELAGQVSGVAMRGGKQPTPHFLYINQQLTLTQV
jgi:hypothetical protein